MSEEAKNDHAISVAIAFKNGTAGPADARTNGDVIIRLFDMLAHRNNDLRARDATIAAQQKEIEALRARIREFDKTIDAERRDPNGTIWEVANTFQTQVEALQAAVAQKDDALRVADHLVINAERILTKIFTGALAEREEVGIIRSELWRYAAEIKAALSPSSTWLTDKLAAARAEVWEEAANLAYGECHGEPINASHCLNCATAVYLFRQMEAKAAALTASRVQDKP